MIKYINKNVASIILFIGSIQWLFMTVLLESFYPNYNSTTYYVSSLGVGTTSFIYNLSLILFGISILLCSITIQRSFGVKILTFFLIMTGIFVINVGLFPENSRPMHGYVTGFTFIFGILSAIASYKVLKPPFSYISITLGVITLIALIFFFPYLGLPKESTVTFLSLGKGTMERIIIFPLMFWMIGFSVTITNTLEK